MSADLIEVIESLRTDLSKLNKQHHNVDEVTFKVSSIEVELNVAVTRSGDGRGEIKWTVLPAILSVQAVASAKAEIEQSHKIKLTLNPQNIGNIAAVREPPAPLPEEVGK